MGVFVFHPAKYISLGAFGSVVSVSCLESETDLARKSVRISMITGITTAPPIKVVVPHTHVSEPFELAPTSLSPV